MVILLTLVAGCGQEAWGQQPDVSGAPPAAVGQDSATMGTSENPPVSSLDQPSLEPGAMPRNFLQPAVMGSQALDTNIGNALNSSAIHGTTRVFGSLLLNRNWKRYETGLAYVGGGALYTGYQHTGSLVQALEAQQQIGWRSGQFAVRDTFSYLPEAGFGAIGAYGLSGVGGGSLGVGIPGLGSAQQVASLGQEPRVTNTVIGEVVQDLTPRSAITASGGYGFVHFVDNSSGFVGSSTASFLTAYNHQFTRSDQLALAYGFVEFHFPSSSQNSIEISPGASVRDQIVSLIYGHRISGRLNFSIAGGPQFIHVSSTGQPSFDRLSAYANMLLHYRLNRTGLSLAYTHRVSNGSGISLGAESDIARAAASRAISRRWECTTDAGFSHNKSLATTVVDQNVTAHVYDYLFVGARLTHNFNRYFTGYLNYQFNDLVLDSAACKSGQSCNAQRHIAIVGVEWHPRPIRLE